MPNGLVLSERVHLNIQYTTCLQPHDGMICVLVCTKFLPIYKDKLYKQYKK